jgi:hypothetical protein
MHEWVAETVELAPLPRPSRACKKVSSDHVEQFEDNTRFKKKPRGWPYLGVAYQHPNENESTIPLGTEGANGVNGLDTVSDGGFSYPGVWEWAEFRYIYAWGWTNYMEHGFPRKNIEVQFLP